MTKFRKYGSVVTLVPLQDVEVPVRKFSTGLGFLALMLFGFQGAAWAANEDTCTAITAIPTTISLAGSYCLTTNLVTTIATTGAAITVNVGDVVIDLAGHTLNDQGAGKGTQFIGIFARDQRNITVRNGTVRGFFVAVEFDDTGSGLSSGHLVENVRADFSTGSGFNVTGVGSVVQKNQVLHSGGVTFLGANPNIFGIVIGGDGARALNNDVVDTAPGTGVAAGIASLTGGVGVVVEGNRVSNSVLPTNGGTSVGIEVELPGTNYLIVNNRVTEMTEGVVFTSGATGSYRDNLTSGVTTPYTGGTNAGNNQ